MDIDRIVQVNITKQTSVPSTASFNALILVAEFLMADAAVPYTVSERVRTYLSLADIATEFGTSHIIYYMAVAAFSQNPSLPSIMVGRKLKGVDGTETWATALTAINAYNSNWYGLAIGNRTEADQQAVAAWVEANIKLCGLGSADADIINSTGDIAEYLHTNNYERTFAIYHPSANISSTDPWPEVALLAKMFTYQPGSATWAMKTLNAVAAYYLTGTQITTAMGKNCNIYTSVAGLDIVQFGTVGSGEYIDVIQGLDWLKAQIQTLVFTPLVNQPKVPYTDLGIQAIVGQVKAGLQSAVENSILIPGYTVQYPLAVNVSAGDKASRTLNNLKFIAQLAGAIHRTVINGTVSY